jgi:hypothetical protein
MPGEGAMGDLQGAPVRSGPVEPLRRSSVRFRILVGFQITVSVIVLANCIGLIATLPKGASAPKPVSLTIFVVIFSIIGWIHILIIAEHIDGKLRWISSIVVGVATLIFYLAGTLLLTVAIAPAQSCSDQDYVKGNTLLAGTGGSRCHLVQANIALFWIGKTLDIGRADNSIRELFYMCGLEIEKGLEEHRK